MFGKLVAALFIGVFITISRVGFENGVMLDLYAFLLFLAFARTRHVLRK